MNFPPHKASLILTHNDHKSYYRTVKESIEQDRHGYDDWISEEQKLKAIETDECWTLQWYPETPVGFCLKSAADLEALLDYVNKEEN